MNSAESQKKALKAIGALISLARFFAYKGRSLDEIAKLLDVVSYLPELMTEKENWKPDFNQTLKDLADRYDECKLVYAKHRLDD